MAFALAGVVASSVGSAWATQKWGPVQFSGNLQTENIVRTPDASTFQYIMNRNIAHLQLEYAWLQGGKFYNKYDIPFVESSTLLIKYRGVYDSVYDTTPGFFPRFDIHGKAYNDKDLYNYLQQDVEPQLVQNLGPKFRGYARRVLSLDSMNHGARDAVKFDSQLREAYIDLKLRSIPLQLRAGRQQIVWGEADNNRLLDRPNALDLTWHFQQEIPAPAYGWDEIRRPYWMFKFLYDLGDIGPLAQNFLEWYWNPGDWEPGKQAFMPRPWGLPILDPLTNPIDGAFNSAICVSSNKKAFSATQGGMVPACDRLMNNTKLFNKGDYSRNPMENSQVGARYHAITPFGLEFTLNYFYQRFAGDDGTNFAQLRGLPKSQNAQAQALERQGIFPAEYIAPYVHTFGVSGNYSDEEFTQAVFRFETLLDFGVPFYDVSKPTVIDAPGPALPGVNKENMWKGMIAFDRPTWIKWLNKKSTWFLTGQFFWHYILNYPDCQGTPADIAFRASHPTPGQKVSPCLVGGLDLPSSVRLTGKVYRDKIRQWESLITFAAFSFYRGGSVVPVLGIALDPVNQFNMEPFWSVDYIVRDDFILNLGQHYFVTPRGHSEPIFETWGLAGLNEGRSETVLRATFQF